MSRKDKLLLRLQRRPNDFTWDELSVLLKSFGYKQAKPGKTGGSRRRFVHPTSATITLHKPHPITFSKSMLLMISLDFLKRRGCYERYDEL